MRRALVLIIVFKITGFTITEDREISVYRLIEGNNVKLSIVSSENVLALQEEFSSEECSVLNYSIEPEIEILVFKDSENTWILANRSDDIIAELSYNFGLNNESVNVDCEVVSGKYFTLSGESLEEVSFDEIYMLNIASLEDIIKSKKKAGQNKDLAVLPILEKTLEEKNGQQK